MKNFVFAGKMRSGKDASADYLKSKIHPSKKMGFADPLYKILHFAQDTIGVPHEKHREFLQFLGTEFGRNTYGKDVWVNAFLREVESHPKETILCTDARFDNELFALKNAGFVCIYVQTLERIRVNRGATNLDHASENGIIEFSDFDYTITGNGTLEELHKQLDFILQKECPELF